jgi:hypothetical protein
MARSHGKTNLLSCWQLPALAGGIVVAAGDESEDLYSCSGWRLVLAMVVIVIRRD